MLPSSKDACSLATSLEMSAIADVALEGLLKQLAQESGSPQIVKGRLKNAFRVVEKALHNGILHDGWCGCEEKLRQGRLNMLGVRDVARAMIVCSHLRMSKRSPQASIVWHRGTVRWRWCG